MLRRLYRDEGGQILLMFSIMVPVIMGMVGLGLEYSRLLMAHSELQNLADAAALAGAKRLDGSTDSIANAKQDALDFSNNNSAKWADGSAYADYQIDAPIVYDEDWNVTTDVKAARYIKVTTKSRSIAPMFLTAVGVTDTKTFTATATAESVFVACAVQPLMMCDPMPEVFGRELNTADDAGRMFRLKGTGGAAAYGPGFFGLLDPPNVGNAGANQIRKNLAQSSPQFCFTNNLSVRTGAAAGPTDDGLNTRFDEFPNGISSDLLIAPPSVNIKGFTAKAQTGNQACNFNPPTTSPQMTAIPDDTSFTPTTGGGAQVGNATYSMSTYWTNNHGGTAPTSVSGMAGSTPTRFDYYRYELGVNPDGTTMTSPPAVTWVSPESPNPTCWASRGNTTRGGLDRRIIYVAIFTDAQCASMNGTNSPAPTGYRMAKFFLTKPADTTGQIYAEFVKMLTPTESDNKLHQIVQLVRDF